jgi:hypothetical protein
MSHASTWRTRSRNNQRECPFGVPEREWYDVTARFKTYGEPTLALLRERGPLTSQQIADILVPGMNAGRMGEVLKILRKQNLATKNQKNWSART